MRILYIHTINQMAKTYARDLELRGHEVTVFEPDVRGAGARLPLKLWLFPRRILSMRRVLRSLHPDYFDLVHIHWASYGIFGLFSKIPFIVHCHGSDVRTRLSHPFFRPLLSASLRQAAAVLCVTPDLLPVVRMVRPDASFSPGPIDTVAFAPIGEQDAAPAHPWTILLFSRLDPDKGSDIAVEGIARFQRRHREVRVQLLDWGPLRERYKQRYARDFDFIPPVPAHHVPQLLASADVIVGQFAFGALGLSELQAMSCAKPVICAFCYADAYPIPPPLCQAGTAEEVDAQLEDLFGEPARGRELGQQARAWILAHHRSTVLSLSLETLYASIVPRACASAMVLDEEEKMREDEVGART